MKKRVLVVFPTAWDERQLAALPDAVHARYELVLDQPRDDDVPWDFDVPAFVDERVRAWRGRLNGVFSSSDYPGAFAAAAIAAELRLPGADPSAVLRAAHKHRSRLLQRGAAPESVPRFALFDPGDERTWPSDDDFPCFVKPVKGSFCLFARRMRDRAELRTFAAAPALSEYRAYYLRMFAQLTARYGGGGDDARAFLAEEPLEGAQVTVEGWVHGDRAHVLGVVDTSFHPGTRSFASFDYPSQLPLAVQERMERIARQVALAHGLRDTLFNVEMFHEASRGRTTLIEVNPRPCGQFGDLYEKVDGTNGFALALGLCCGDPPAVRRRAGAFAAASSVPLRVFRSSRIRRAPSAAELCAVERAHPGTLLWSDCASGAELRVAPHVEDGESVRYGVVNLGGASRGDVRARLADVVEALGFELSPLEPSGARPVR
jgi:biotin carboxylase